LYKNNLNINKLIDAIRRIFSCMYLKNAFSAILRYNQKNRTICLKSEQRK
jgi:hypothetical protein